MNKCPRCLKTFKDLNGYHTCTPAKYKSDCCGSRVYIICGRHRYLDADEVKIKRGNTYYYECVECEKPCDGEPLKEIDNGTE